AQPEAPADLANDPAPAPGPRDSGGIAYQANNRAACRVSAGTVSVSVAYTERTMRAVTPIFLALLATPSLAFDLEGHRGTRGLAPENTLVAFRRAIEIGVTTIETDMAVTKDDVVVISHDPLLNPDIVRGPDGQWLASQGPP